jgi:VWFA-related protein
VKLDVNLVGVEASVTDANGTPVLTLKQEDFEILEDGERQEIKSFAAVDTPYNVLLLFDCSGSTEPNWPFLRDAMGRFSAGLRRQDVLSVAQFGGDFRRVLPWTAVSEKSIEAEIRVSDGGCAGTDLYGALERSLSEFKPGMGRKGVIVLTDGKHQRIPYQKVSPATALYSRYVDPVEEAPFQNLLRAIRRSSTPFYFVAVNTDLNPSPPAANRGYDPMEIYNMQQARLRLELIAEASGGRVSYPKYPGDVVPLFEQIGRDLGTSYGLAYSPSSEGSGYRKIEVRVRDRNLKVRQSRDGISR